MTTVSSIFGSFVGRSDNYKTPIYICTIFFGIGTLRTLPPGTIPSWDEAFSQHIVSLFIEIIGNNMHYPSFLMKHIFFPY